MIAPAVDVPAAGYRLVHAPQSVGAGAQRIRVLDLRAIGADRHRANTDIYADGRSVLDWRRILAIFNAEAREPRSGSPVDGHLPNGTMEPQFFGHRHPADLGQDDDFAIHFHRVRTVVGPKALLVLPALEPRETHTATSTLTILHPEAAKAARTPRP